MIDVDDSPFPGLGPAGGESVSSHPVIAIIIALSVRHFGSSMIALAKFELKSILSFDGQR